GQRSDRQHGEDFVDHLNAQRIVRLRDAKDHQLPGLRRLFHCGHVFTPPTLKGSSEHERPLWSPRDCLCYHHGVSFTTTATARLEDIGFRSTAPRRAVLNAIEEVEGAFTVEDLLTELPDVGRATVFRTIKLLQE